MLLSTSVSDLSNRSIRVDRFTIALLSTILVILAGLELVSRARFDSTSRVQRREVAERAALLLVRDSGAARDRHIAMLGNSLMLEGVGLPLFQATLNPRYVPVPYFVLGTNYYDWFFGLRRLFAEGAHPEYVLLGLSPNELATSEVRGDFTARYMVQQSDLLRIVKLTHMDATRASEFMLSHYSEYYSTREITRGYVMSRVLPSVGEMFHSRYASVHDPELSESVLQKLATDRLVALDQLCRANGAHLIFVVPPTYEKGADVIQAAGLAHGIKILVPVRDNEFDDGDYQEDRIHMNEKGAHVFTLRLADLVNSELPK
jgi:hypothetical protein